MKLFKKKKKVDELVLATEKYNKALEDITVQLKVMNKLTEDIFYIIERVESHIIVSKGTNSKLETVLNGLNQGNIVLGRLYDDRVN